MNAGMVNSPNFLTVALALSDDAKVALGKEVEINGIKAKCMSLSWETNSIRKSFALQQRLEIALELIQQENLEDEYKQKLQDLRDDDELTELPDMPEFDLEE